MLVSSEARSQLVATLYDAAADPYLWDPFLCQLANILRAESAGLLVRNVHTNGFYNSWQIDSDLARLHREYYHSVDIWWLRGASLPAGSVCTSQSLCSLDQLKTTEAYNDCLVHFGIEHGLFALLENNGSMAASISLFRGPKTAEFDSSEMHLLESLASHLRRAFKLHMEFSELRKRSTGFESALDMISTGVVLFEASGKIACMNRAAIALIEQKDGLFATPDGLKAERKEELDLLTNVVQRAALSRKGKVRTGGTVVISRRTRGPIQVLVSPIGNSAANGLSGGITAIAFLLDPSQRQRPAKDILRTLFGLTPGESRVALLLGDGYTPKEIAGKIGVSVETVRSHMKSSFSKANVRRQSELVRLLLSNSGLMVPETSPEKP